MKTLRVLLVDDDRNILKTLSLALKAQHCQVTQADSVQAAQGELEAAVYDLILTDYRMRDKTGSDLLRSARELRPSALIAVMTAFASIDNAIEVTKEGAFDYLPKPFTQAQLSNLLKKIRLIVELREENELLKAREKSEGWLTGLPSLASHRLSEFIRKTAPTDATLLLVGESGTGKTRMAKLIHDRSPRCQGPFVAGAYEFAQGGTLFFDEVSELSAEEQAKLLRFLQNKVIERDGRAIRIDARVIAATSRNLPELVAQGGFREDLYFHLNAFECPLVPLRYRAEDLPVLIEKILEEWGRSGPISEELRSKLLAYSWPGNLRELKNTIERLATLSEGGPLRVEDLPESILSPETAKNPSFRTLEEVEREHIEHVLSIESNLDRAAEILGITKVTLWRKRKEYGLP